MKNYNEEYFYLMESGNQYPMLEYDSDGGDSMEVYDEIPLDLSVNKSFK